MVGGGGIKSEIPTLPTDPIVDDPQTQGQTPDDTDDVDIDETVTIDYYKGIQGNVYESLDHETDVDTSKDDDVSMQRSFRCLCGVKWSNRCTNK